MYIFSLFEHSLSVELALTKLEKEGIPRSNIYAVPIQNTEKELKIFDTMHDSDGMSLFDIPMALATAFSVVGTSLGFKLAWGPIYWGLITAFIGFALGFIVKIVIIKTRRTVGRREKRMLPLIILIVDAEAPIVEQVEIILKENKALGVTTPQKEKSHSRDIK